jgi:hypothetical protein
VRAPVACRDSLHETPKNYWTADLRSIVPVQERGWHPGDYYCESRFPMMNRL